MFYAGDGGGGGFTSASVFQAQADAVIDAIQDFERRAFHLLQQALPAPL